MGYLGGEERLGRVREVLKLTEGTVEFAEPQETLAHVAHRMNELGISQMPVIRSNGGPQLMIHEVDLLQSLVSGRCSADDTVVKAAKPLMGKVGVDDSLSRVQEVFDDDNVAVVVENDQVIGIIGKIDMVEFLAARS